ncbi:MAG: hypothetical protein ABI186_04370 [Candidatus Elarobacter sp.]
MNDVDTQSRGRWIFVGAIVVFAAIYELTQYALKRDPSSLGQNVEMCAQGYGNSRSARDTAHVDSLTPPEVTSLRHAQMRTCGWFRERGATKTSLK